MCVCKIPSDIADVTLTATDVIGTCLRRENASSPPFCVSLQQCSAVMPDGGAALELKDSACSVSVFLSAARDIDLENIDDICLRGKPVCVCEGERERRELCSCRTAVCASVSLSVCAAGTAMCVCRCVCVCVTAELEKA